MDETYIKVEDQWVYLYQAVDKFGDTLDFILSERRDEEAATAFFKQTSNKETSLRDEASDWEGVCIPSPIRAQESNFASLVAVAPFGLKAEV